MSSIYYSPVMDKDTYKVYVKIEIFPYLIMLGELRFLDICQADRK